MSRFLAAFAALALIAAAPAPPKPPGAPVPPHHAAPRLPPGAIADELVKLAFDGNPAEQIPPRDVLSRWADPVRLAVFGRPADVGEAARAAALLSQASKLPMQVMTRMGMGSLLPNAFMVVSPDLANEFRTRLRPMLLNAFLDDEVAADEFVEIVVAVEPCWVLPVWTDQMHLVLKAAMVGIDAKLPPAERQRCMLQKLGAGLGLLGSEASLPNSIFAAQSHATRLSREDAAMLRLFYGPALRIGMTRDEARAAAEAALRTRPVARPHPPQPPKPPVR